MPNFKNFKSKRAHVNGQHEQTTEHASPSAIEIEEKDVTTISDDEEDELSSLREKTDQMALKEPKPSPAETGKQAAPPRPAPIASSYFSTLNKLNENKEKKPVSRTLLSSDEEDVDSKASGRVKFPLSVFSTPSTLAILEPGVNRDKVPYTIVKRANPAKKRGPAKRRFVVDDDDDDESGSSNDSDSSRVSDISDIISSRSARVAKRRKQREDQDVLEQCEEMLKNEKRKKKAKRIKKPIDSDEDEIAQDFSSSSEDEQYEDLERLDSTSSEDDEGKPARKGKSKAKPKKKLVKSAEQITFENEARKTLRDRVVTFMNEANEQELSTIQTISLRKAQEIIKLRPFESYSDLKDKIESKRVFNYDLIDKVLEAVRSRDNVRALMMQCESISESIKSLVDEVTPATQPSFLNKKCKLMDYQLIGLNWLALMHKQGINSILADEMGLGKTIQVIAFLAYLKEVHNINGPHLIVVPASTLDNWDREFSTWAPKFDLLVYHGTMDERLEIRMKTERKEFTFEIMLTTYTMAFAKDDAKFLKRQSFNYIVFDEAHLLKNMKTLKYDKLLRLKSKNRLMLTGTPLQNNLLELMSLLVFTMPSLFLPKLNSVKALFMSNNFNSVFTANSRSPTDDYVSPFERERIEHAKNMLNPFILRRVKANVLKTLPKKTIIIERVAMSKSQQQIYDELISSYKKTAIKDDSITDIDPDEVEKENSNKAKANKKGQSGVSQRQGSSMLMNLRKVANHPLLIRNHYDDKKLTRMSELMLKEPTHHDASAKFIKEDMEYLTDHELHLLCLKYKSISRFKLTDSQLLDSGKLAFFDRVLPDLYAKGEKVLIFSQFCITLDLIEFYMESRNYPFLRLDGSTKIHERLDLIDDFNNDNDATLIVNQSEVNGATDEEEADGENSRLSRISKSSKASDDSESKAKKVFAFLLTTKAGGVGINLTAATTAIIHDIDFNPFNDKQAEDRCHRLGQTRDVTIYKLISEGTVEEGILALAEKKMKLGEDIQATRDAILTNSPVKSPTRRQTKAAKVTRSKDMQNLLKKTLGIFT